MHLEAEAVVASAVRIGYWHEPQQTRIYIGFRDELVQCDVDSIQLQGTDALQRRDLDLTERIAIHVDIVEVSRREDIGRVLDGRDRTVGGGRRVLDRRDGDGRGHRSTLGRNRRAVLGGLHSEGTSCRAVQIRRELQTCIAFGKGDIATVRDDRRTIILVERAASDVADPEVRDFGTVIDVAGKDDRG